MTSGIHFPCYIIGLMSGTSADGVDAALIHTDGRSQVRTHESVFVPYDDALRADILGLMRGVGDTEAVARALTLTHIEAVDRLCLASPVAAQDIKLIGFHGQTIRHAPKEGITVQIGDPALMAERLRIPVVADFRSADVKAGGQGAPLVPLYHAALAASLPKPLMVVNIGGVANVTWLGADGSILAFDCGPGNALIDDWVSKHTHARYDKNGALAAKGTVDEVTLWQWLDDPFFAHVPPKSLDRNHFNRITSDGHAWSTEDGAATLTAFTAAAIAKACEVVPVKPERLLITGGGRHNAALMHMIKAYSHCHVDAVEHVGWNGDMLEAEAFAYLAARSAQGLPLSLPETTGVREAVTGGKLYDGSEPHHHDDEDCTTPRSCCR